MEIIPDDARRAGWDEFAAAVRDKADPGQVYARAVHAAAPLILAAELERLAAQIESREDGDDTSFLRDRAAELRTPATKETNRDA